MYTFAVWSHRQRNISNGIQMHLVTYIHVRIVIRSQCDAFIRIYVYWYRHPVNFTRAHGVRSPFFFGDTTLLASPTLHRFERGHAEGVGDLATMAAPPMHSALANG